MLKRTNQKEMQTVLVPSGDANLKATGALVSSTTALNIADGQLGVLSWDFDGTVALGSFVGAANADVDKVNAIRIVQGTPNSGQTQNVNVFEHQDPGYVISGTIFADSIRSVTTTLYRVPKNSTHIVHTITAPADETLYKIYAYQYSIRDDKEWGDNDNSSFATYTTPNYTLLGTTNTTDHFLKNILYRLNLNSMLLNGHKRYVTLAIDTTGVAGGTVIGDLECGDTFSFQTDGTSTYALAITETIMKALKAACVSQSIDETVATLELIDLSTAGDNAAGVDAFVCIGLPYEPAAYFDDIAPLMPTVELSLSENITATDELLGADQGAGVGRQVYYANRKRNQLTRHTMQTQPFGEFFSEGFNYLNPNKNYTCYMIEYYDREETLTTREISPKRIFIFMEATSVVCDDTIENLDNDPANQTATDDTTTVSDLNSILAAWLKTARLKFQSFELLGSATSTTYFV